MIRFKDIQIPRPCSVPYDLLPGDDIKRFCGSCEKHVYDFRGKDEAYLNTIFKETGKVCGVYYTDQIQPSTLRIKRPFFYVLTTKIIGIAFFLKMLLSSHNTQAATPAVYKISQISKDSTEKIPVAFKNRPSVSSYYSMNIYINGLLYKSHIKADSGYIYLPDSIQKNDQIKVIVTKTYPDRHKRISYVVKQREYNFTYSEADDITVTVSYTKKITLIKRKYVMGYY